MANLNRRHYQRIAEILGEGNMAPELVLEFSELLKETNPLYDKERFIKTVSEVRTDKSAIVVDGSNQRKFFIAVRDELDTFVFGLLNIRRHVYNVSDTKASKIIAFLLGSKKEKIKK